MMLHRNFFTLLLAFGTSAMVPSLLDGQGPQRSFEAALELRIDGYDADLVPVHSMAVALDGTIALLQRQDSRILFFDSSGELLGDFGRSGEGPGEFSEQLTRIGWVGDTLWVADLGRRRITLVSPNQTLARIQPWSRARVRPADSDRFPVFPSPLPLPEAVLSEGSLLLRGISDGRTTVMRASADGTVQSIVLETGPPPGRSSVRLSAAAGNISLPVPFAMRGLVEIAADGRRAVGVSATWQENPVFNVTLVAASGDTIYTHEYRYEPLPVPAEAVDSAMRAIAGTDLVRRAAGAKLRELLEQIRRAIPAYLPPVVDVIVGQDGTVWLGMQPTEAGRPWWILGHRGELLGKVNVPVKVSLREASGMRAWGLERDDWGIESVVRYRLEPAGS